MYVVTYDYRAGDVSPQRHPLCLPPCVAEVAPGVPLLCRCRAVPGSTPGTPVGASSKGDDSEQLLGQTGWRLDYMCVWGGERNILRISALGHVQCLFPAGALGQPGGCWPGPLRRPCTWEMLFTASPCSPTYLRGQERPSDPRPADKPTGSS